MADMQVVLAKDAPPAWKQPEVVQAISQRVLYQPISDPSVCALTIKGSKDPLIDLRTVDNPRLVPMSDIDAAFKNNDYKGWSKVRTGVYERLNVMLTLLPEDIGIAYYEGFRSLAQQKHYFDKKFRELLPTMPDKYATYQETTKHVSPFIDNIPTHATGAAIDMTLFERKNGKMHLLDMGMFDVIYGENAQQETFSENTSIFQRKNRLMLLKSAIQAGFANYGFEWWHFSYGDKMHALVYHLPQAKYGLATKKDIHLLHISLEAYLKTMTS